MKGKGLLNTYTMGNFTDSEGGVHGSAFTLENHALENLNTLFVALNDADVYLNGITGTKVRHVKAHLLQIDLI